MEDMDGWRVETGVRRVLPVSICLGLTFVDGLLREQRRST